MSFDPYAVLGIQKDATDRQVKAAYYARARATHPDIAHTTDARPFQDVVRAFGILSDPDRRARFDETGTVDEVDHAKERKAAMGLLVELFDKLVSTAGKKGSRLRSVNFIQGLRELVDRNVNDAQNEQADLRDKIAERLDLRGRITRQSDGPNLFADSLTKQIAELQEGLELQVKRLRILEVARTELGNYRNEVELVSAFQMAEYGYTSSSSANGWTIVRMNQW